MVTASPSRAQASTVWAMQTIRAAVMAVGHMADQQHQQDRGDELDQPDQAEIKGPTGQVVDLPADRHPHHLVGDRCSGSGADKHQQRAVPQKGEAGGRRQVACQGISFSEMAHYLP